MSKETILVIDDDMHLPIVLKKAVSEYHFVHFPTAEEGLAYLRQGAKVNAILLDLNLMGMDGFDALRYLKSEGYPQGVIVISAQKDQETLTQLIESRADAFLEKPLEMSALKRKIEKILINTDFYKDNQRFLKSKLRHTKSYLKKHLHGSLTLSKLSEKAAYNPKYFSRVFKSTEGEAFSTYKRTLLMQKAVKYLQNPDMPILKIAEILGYAHASSFIRAFKKVYGCSPQVFRSKLDHHSKQL